MTAWGGAQSQRYLIVLKEKCRREEDEMQRMRPDRNFVAGQAERMQYLLRERAALPREELEYLVSALAKLKDERFKACVTELIGWGDEERAEIETFVAIAIEVMKRTNVSKLRECAQIVELRYWVNNDQQREANGGS
jgi:hypothetical protein